MNTDSDLLTVLDALSGRAPSDADIRQALAGRIDLRARRRRTASLVAAAAAVVMFAGGAGITGAWMSHRTAGPAAPAPMVSTAGTERSSTAAGIAAAQRAVVTGYLDAVKAGDCVAADRYFVAGKAQVGSGDLCQAGSLRLLGYQIAGVPARPSPDEAVLAVTITTSGGDGSIPDGDTTWFLVLHRQAGGDWLLTGGGTGP